LLVGSCLALAVVYGQGDGDKRLRQSDLYRTDATFRKQVDDGLSAEAAASLLHAYSLRERAITVAQNPVEIVRDIKGSVLYRDSGVAESSSWLSRALERLKNLLKPPERRNPALRSGLGFLGPWLTWLMWILLGAAVCVFAYLALKHYRWKARLVRRSSALLDEDEPERSVDEWLARAAELESQGEYRQAVRCLYLACLVRFDEAGLSRFIRGQTNWEHLRRLRQKHPEYESAFRQPTRLFDQVWYGQSSADREVVEVFRKTYDEVLNWTQQKGAV
jgi:hypothetical protein